MTTQDFLDLLDPRLAREALRYVDEPGLPADAPVARSERLSALQAGSAEPRNPTELLVVLQSARPDPALLATLDARHGLAGRKSLELRHAFVLLQLRAGLPEAVEGARKVALETGRMKYLRPIFSELVKRDRAAAERIFAEARGGYHPIARAVVEGLISAA